METKQQVDGEGFFFEFEVFIRKSKGKELNGMRMIRCTPKDHPCKFIMMGCDLCLFESFCTEANKNE
jgi:hypothetical protein